LTVAGGSASVTFQPKALDMVHSRTQGIPRLINLVCDRSLLAAYSGRTNRISAEMVYQAAESLELVEERPSRFNWFRRRASAVVMAAGASVTLGVGGSMVAPALRASAASTDVREANSDAVPAVAPAPLHSSAPNAPNAPSTRYSVLTASFPAADISRAGSAAGARLDAVVGQLKELGYDARVMDVDLGDGGEWRRVLIGEFATRADAEAQAARVQEMAAFADAQVIRH
jgi:general secretion pathway protein A